MNLSGGCVVTVWPETKKAGTRAGFFAGFVVVGVARFELTAPASRRQVLGGYIGMHHVT